MSPREVDESVTKTEEAPTFVSSLPVPNVQEMVKKDPLQVPSRYARTEEEMEKENYLPHLSSEVPIIDFALLSNGDKEELLKFDTALKEWGFIQVVNHGIKKDLLQRMKELTNEFFELPVEEKNKYAMAQNDIQGYGHTGVASEEQILDWSDQLMLLVYPTKFRKLPFWPETPEGFKDMIEAYSSETRRVGRELISTLSVIMGLQKHELLDLNNEGLQGLRINYYPPCSTPEKVMGLGPHSDSTTISLILQDDDVSGLEVRHKGSWVPVAPVPDALVVNIGDTIEIWSNGRYKSIEHRALTNQNKKRTSHVSILFPSDDAEIEPFDLMIDAENPQLYQKVKYGDYMRETLSRKLVGKNLGQAKKTGSAEP